MSWSPDLVLKAPGSHGSILGANNMARCAVASSQRGCCVATLVLLVQASWGWGWGLGMTSLRLGSDSSSFPWLLGPLWFGPLVLSRLPACGAQPLSLCSVTLPSPRFLIRAASPARDFPPFPSAAPSVCRAPSHPSALSGVVTSIETSSVSVSPTLEQTPYPHPSLYEPFALSFIPLRALRILPLNDCVTLSHHTVGFMRIGALFIPCKAQKQQLCWGHGFMLGIPCWHQQGADSNPSKNW